MTVVIDTRCDLISVYPRGDFGDRKGRPYAEIPYRDGKPVPYIPNS